MSKQSQAIEAKAKQNKQKSEPASIQERQGESMMVIDFPNGPIGAADQPFLQAQAERLGDARLQIAQRQALATQIGRVQGNRHIQRVMALQSIQRQDGADAGTAEAGVTTEDKPTFDFVSKGQEDTHFDSTYTPVGPAPQVGTLDINLWVSITYAPFTRKMMRKEPYRSYRFSREQMADFAWTDAEKEKFETDFMTSVMDGWSGHYTFHLDDPDFSEYRCKVNVNVLTISDPGQAHTKITAQKIPKGAPRFRSFVAGDEATLDIRDPSEPETHQVVDRPVVRQIKPFGFDKSDLTPDLESQVGEVDQKLKEVGATQAPGSKDYIAIFRGVASARGNRNYNKKLGQRRADAVRARITADLRWAEVLVDSRGEENASTDEKFQRVDISVRTKNPKEVTQNVAAHEAGHMLGLGDEYVDETPGGDTLPKFFGDEPEHYGDVQALMGTDTANELLVQDSGSMMSMGSTVQKGHYVYFLEALNSLTGKSWSIE
jgi:outer membrane protein OmpA-like peptidoglycan-associated protein